MLRSGCLALLGVFASSARPAELRIAVSASTYAGQRVLLYRHMDLFTGRTELLAQGRIDERGQAELQCEIAGTQKGSLRIGEVGADLWLRSGRYQVEFPAADPRRPKSVNGTSEVDLLFKDIDALDINALMADLNLRLDDFIARDLATDPASGMRAVDQARRGTGTMAPDTSKRPGTLFITPNWSAERVDTFETKLRAFYAEVKDPWFWQNLEYGVAGLRFGPRTNDRGLFERYVKDKPVLHDVPEYVRFIGSFFEDHVMRGPFQVNEVALKAWIQAANMDSVKKLFARSDFLKDDRLCELVMMNELYAQYPGKHFDRKGILHILQTLSRTSGHPEHRRIAADMHWDLTAMKPGGTLPSLTLRDLGGAQMRLDTAMHDATCVMVTAGWCTYCEQELIALEALVKEYGAYVNVVVIGLDRELSELKALARSHPGIDRTWLFAGDDPSVMDLLRVRGIPAFFLLNGNELVYSPAPPPSNGLAAILHRLKVQADEQNKLKPDQGPPERRR